MSSFNVLRDRDAYPVIRGFRYQVDQTILRWLDLAGDQSLELERGEDIDLVNRAVVNGDPLSRLVEQVKHLAVPVTLKSLPCVEALANALEHREANPGLRLAFRFSTNARPTIERPSPFMPRRPGLVVWEALRTDLEDASADKVAALRSILSRAARPDGLPEVTWARFVDFVSRADDDEFVRLIAAFEWGLGMDGAEDLEPRITGRLIADGRAVDALAAGRLYRLLFLTVIKRLSLPGLKLLTPADLAALSGAGELAVGDAALLRRVEEDILSLERRVTAVEATVRSQGDQLMALIAARQQYAGQVIDDMGAVAIDVPPSINRGVGRPRVAGRLLAALRAAVWLPLYGGVGTGKTELSKLIATAGDFRATAFISLRDRSPAEAELDVLKSLRVVAGLGRDVDWNTLATAAAGRLSPNGLLVIDDLPAIAIGDRLGRLLLDLCAACGARDVRVLTSSHHPPADGVSAQLGAGSCPATVVPPFEDAEALDLLNAWGMPAGAMDARGVKALNVWAEGHPTLLAALARHLAARGWRADEVDAILLDRGRIGVTDEAVRRLLATVDDAADRQLLYRLCLIHGAFERQVALLVASVGAPLDRPRERITRLSGPWIQSMEEGRMLISPLVRPLAATELPADERRAVLVSLAGEIVARRRKSVVDVGVAVAYLTAADAFGRACSLLIVAFNAARDLPEGQARFLLTISWTTEPLPPQVDVGDGLYLRGFQISACDRIGRPSAALFRDADALIARSSAADGWAVFAFAVQTLRVRGQIDFPGAIRDMGRAADAFTNMSLPGGAPARLPADLRPASLLWQPVNCVRSHAHLSLWVDALEAFPPEDVAAAFGPREESYQACMLATDGAWLGEHEHPPAERDWGAVERALRRAQSAGERLKLEPLIAAAARARIVVLADYLKSIGAAVELADEMLSAPRQPGFVLLISEGLGRQFVILGRHDQGASWLRRAIAVETTWFANLQFDARIYLSEAVAVGDGDAAAALALAEAAAAIIRDQPRSAWGLRRAAAAAELAVARWLAGDLSQSFRAYDVAAEELLACREMTVEWKSMFMMVAHAGGYLSQLAGGKEAAPISSGEPYAPPYRLMFVTAYREDRAALYDAERESAFASLLCLFAEAVGDDDAAARWANRGIDDARAQGSLAGVSVLGWQSAVQLVRQGRYVDALDTACETAAASVALQSLKDRGVSVTSVGADADRVLREAAGDAQERADRMAVNWVGLSVSFALAAVSLDDRAAAAASAEAVVTFCRSVATAVDGARLWSSLAAALEASHVRPVPARDLNRLANEASRAGQPTVYLVGYLGLSLLAETSLVDAAVAHVMIMPFVERTTGTDSSMYRQLVVPLIGRFWQRAIASQAFQFSVPGLVRRELDDAMSGPLKGRVRAILKAVTRGLAIGLPPGAEAGRQWLSET